VQSVPKQLETKRQVENMAAHHVIRPVSQPTLSYSQVLLTPKANGQSVTKNLEWPIPNIPLMLQRLGMARPKYFAVMDLAKGYYQAPLAESSRNLTAFITILGLYEWCRVPMDLKGAPTYFQCIMSTIVLMGLVWKICEVYLDDVIVHAQTEDDLIKNLTTVFERFRKHNITLNPEICRFGMSETEYVGKVINSEGIKFSDSKKDEVFNFRIPERLGELKSFIGLCEYFHSHVRNFSLTMKPLHTLLHGYTRSARHTKLKMTSEAIESFRAIQQAIANCATLFFLDERAEIVLQTDASEYGIGAYLIQIIDGIERP
jgi:hypothetical protein